MMGGIEVALAADVVVLDCFCGGVGVFFLCRVAGRCSHGSCRVFSSGGVGSSRTPVVVADLLSL